jgi:hypothetical protein
MRRRRLGTFNPHVLILSLSHLICLLIFPFVYFEVGEKLHMPILVTTLVLAGVVAVLMILFAGAYLYALMIRQNANIILEATSLNDARDIQKIKALSDFARQANRAGVTPPPELLDVVSTGEWLPEPNTMGGPK